MRWLENMKRVAAGLMVLVLAAMPAAAEVFTIAVVPDTQNYSDVTLPQPRGEETFAQQMHYLVDQKAAKNIVFATFVGDIVQYGDGRFRKGAEGDHTYWDTRAEWDVATRSVTILSRSGIPFGMSPGNHDYDSYGWWDGEGSPGVARPLRGGRTWNYYFGPDSRHFHGKAWYGGSFNDGMNSYQTFTAAGKTFLHLSLEMEPNPAALKWAQGVLDAHPGLPVIVTTHEWLEPSLTGETNRSNGYKAYFDGADNLPPDEVWDRFIRKNPMIFMVLCGHNFLRPVDGVSHGENLRVNLNDAGYPVYQLLQDYQGNTVGPDGKPDTANGGAGWLRFLAFDTERRKIHVYTYSPLLDRYAGRGGESTFGAGAHHSDFELNFPPQLLKVNGK